MRFACRTAATQHRPQREQSDGDYGELVFATAFGWTLNGNSSADTGALDSDDIRLQIKCRRRLATPQDSRQLGFIGRLSAASRIM